MLSPLTWLNCKTNFSMVELNPEFPCGGLKLTEFLWPHSSNTPSYQKVKQKNICSPKFRKHCSPNDTFWGLRYGLQGCTITPHGPSGVRPLTHFLPSLRVLGLLRWFSVEYPLAGSLGPSVVRKRAEVTNWSSSNLTNVLTALLVFSLAREFIKTPLKLPANLSHLFSLLAYQKS